MSCCPRETESQHPRSPSPVQDPEWVARAAYKPMHFGRDGLKKAFIQRKRLLEGELSVWRVSRTEDFGCPEVRTELEKSTPADNSLEQILGAKVEELRKATVQTDAGALRAFCVLDDCRTDENDGFHVEHAVVALAVHEQADLAQDDDLFDLAVTGLMDVFRRHDLVD